MVAWVGLAFALGLAAGLGVGYVVATLRLVGLLANLTPSELGSLATKVVAHRKRDRDAA